MHPKKILHPTDYSEESRHALRAAADLAREHGAELVLLHVVGTLGPEHLSFGEVEEPQPASYRKQLWEELRRARPDDPGLRVEYVLSEEDVPTAVLRVASDLHCDLIVLGTHGATGWQRWFSGSIAEAVVRRAPCDVLVVKEPRPSQPLPPYPASSLHPGYLVEKEG